jgi:AraC family transcriptional regulator
MASRFFRYPDHGLDIQVFHHEHAISFPEHSHSEMAIVICTDGVLESTQFGHREFLYPGQVLFTNSCIPHASRYCIDGRPTRGVTLEFDPVVLQRLGYSASSIYLSAMLLGKMNLPEVARLARMIQDESRQIEQDSPLLMAALARQIVVLVLRMWPRTLIHSHQLQRAIHLPRNEFVRSIEFMQATPVREFAVHKLAGHLYRSTSTFSRLFTCSVGESPYSFYLTTVLQRAANQLATTDIPVKVIALNLGFNSVSHFSSSFRMKWNMTPTAFRQSANGIWQFDASSLPSNAFPSDYVSALNAEAHEVAAKSIRRRRVGDTDKMAPTEIDRLVVNY